MKKVVLLLFCISISLFSVSAKKSAKKTVLKTEKDTTSYALGIEFAKSIQSNIVNMHGGPYDMNLLSEALTAFLKADTANLILNVNSSQEILMANLKKAEELQNQKVIAEGNTFLENNKKNPNVIVTGSGLQYEVIKMGTGEKPAATDKVKANYRGYLIDGTTFDSSYDRGEPAEFELNRVIKGWTEGLQLMPVGSKFKFYIPSELGYGKRGTGAIKPYSVLIFEVELLDIQKAAAPQNNNTIGGSKYQFQQYQKSTK